jgi:hypothetical protein
MALLAGGLYRRYRERIAHIFQVPFASTESSAAHLYRLRIYAHFALLSFFAILRRSIADFSDAVSIVLTGLVYFLSVIFDLESSQLFLASVDFLLVHPTRICGRDRSRGQNGGTGKRSRIK